MLEHNSGHDKLFLIDFSNLVLIGNVHLVTTNYIESGSSLVIVFSLSIQAAFQAKKYEMILHIFFKCENNFTYLRRIF